MNIDYNRPFSDWLSISHALSQSPHHEVLAFLGKLCKFDHIDHGRGVETYLCESGSLKTTISKKSINLSFSGSLLSLVRASGAINDFIMILGSAPYNITRLDAALDTPVAGEIIYKQIRTLYPSGKATISGRERQMSFVINPSLAGDTGTFYFQTKSYKGYQKLRVYDKANEVLTKKGIEIPPTTRYELSVARGASLRDFIDPTNLFFHYIPCELVRPTKGMVVQAWKPQQRIEYDETVTFLRTDYEEFKRMIENHPALLSILERATSVHGGSELLIRFIKQRLEKNGEAMQRSGNNCDADTTSLSKALGS